MTTKRRVVSVVRVDAYAVIRRAVEEGVQYGWNRAHKHTETPDPGAVVEHMEIGVMNALCEVLDFGSDE